MYEIFGEFIDDPEAVDIHFEFMDIGDANHEDFVERMKKYSD